MDIVFQPKAEYLRQLAAIEIIVRTVHHTQIKKINSKKKRSIWVRPFWQRGEKNQIFAKIMTELRAEGDDFFRNFVRVSDEDFQLICEKVRPLIQRQNTNMRVAITVEERVALTLKHLSSGSNYNKISQIFRISRPSISTIVPQVCEAIYKTLAPNFLKTPKTTCEWKKIASEFEKKWNFPNCIGALDGKHIACKASANSGSAYFNYKGVHSIVMMGIVDANYRFLYVNIGAKGSGSDGGIFAECPFSKALESNSLEVPAHCPLPGRTLPVPFCLVADEAFASSMRILKPIGNRNLTTDQRVYKYRLSRARRTVENAFGILSARWRVLRTTMEYPPETIKKVVSAVSVLHNFCMRTQNDYARIADFENAGNVTPGEWRTEGIDPLPSLRHLPSQSSSETNAIRNEFIQYFTSKEGELSWQYAVC